MYVLPVIDLLHGLAVRAVAGQRDRYLPVQSVLTDSHQPIDVAESIRHNLGLNQFYVADLDAILHRQPQFGIHRQLADAGFSTLIDAGVQSVTEVERALNGGATNVIVGLETWPSADLLGDLLRDIDGERVWFSLDLKAGRALAGPGWGELSPLEIAQRVIEQGIRQMIILDLAQVGMSRGVQTLELCQQIQARWPDVRLITGGGIRSASDLVGLKQGGFYGALVASALHDGAISRDEIETSTR